MNTASLILWLLAGLVSCTAAQVPAPSEKPPPPPIKPAGRPVAPPDAKPPVPPEVPLHELKVGEVAVKVRLALTAAQRFTGLEGVTSLPENQGMLFAYQQKEIRRFWMKGCKIPLDIAFLADDGRVLSVHTLDPPAPDKKDEDLKRAAAPEPSRLVLEMAGGWFKKQGLGVGTRVTIPATVPLQKAE